MNKMTMRVLPALMLAAFSGAASASAFQLWEQNASGLGVAYAGSAAVAENASAGFFNPASLSQLTGIQVSAGVTGVGPSYKFHNGSSSGLGVPGSNGGDAGSWAAVPNAHFAWQLAPNWVAGFSVSAPFGLATEYKDSSWIGRNQSMKSEVRSINYNPSLAYRVNDQWSLGLGLNYQTINAELTSIVPTTTALARVKGDDSAWGWNAGALFTPSPAMRIGVSYRSSMKYTLEGNMTTPLGVTPVRADLKLPDTAILSIWQQVSDRWEAMGDLSYTRWSTLKTLDVVSRTGSVPMTTEIFNYKNSWRLAWGAAYQASDAVKLKFGIAYDRTPTTDAYRSPRVPDNNRLWLSLGGQWNMGNAGKLDLGYSYLYVKDPTINKTSGGTTLNGSYDDQAHIVGVQYSVGF